MKLLLRTAFLVSIAAPTHIAGAETTAPSSIRMIDLNSDRHKDLLEIGEDGSLVVSMGMGQREFRAIIQDLPTARVTDLLVADLNGDSFPDLYLVTPNANIALAGDGTGYLTEVTAQWGLEDFGVGIDVSWSDLDDDGFSDLVLHNQRGDVLFWGVPGGFERDVRTPIPSPPAAATSNAIALELSDAQPIVREDTKRHSTAARVPSANTTRSPVSSSTPIDDAHSAAPLASVAVTTLPVDPLNLNRTKLKFQFALSEEEKEILSHLSIQQLPDGLGGTVKTIRFTGANVQIVNGLSATNGNAAAPDGLVGTTNGLGNLIVGYNELGNPVVDERTGSHNLVIGHGHSYSSFGGIVAGQDNLIRGAFATITAGTLNESSGAHSSISGGESNVVSGNRSSVSGGKANTANSYYSTVSGGRNNLAGDYASAVSGGRSNTAGSVDSSISGGQQNLASGLAASLSGGFRNTASGSQTSISGGQLNRTAGSYSTIAGGRSNLTTGLSASILGGFANTASGIESTVSGGQMNTVSSSASFGSVSGGQYNFTGAISGSVSGGALNTVSAFSASISGGENNATSGNYSSISGGSFNDASGLRSSVSGGQGNLASGTNTSVSGGSTNAAIFSRSSISGGRGNQTYGAYSHISGGQSNVTTGSRSVVSGGKSNRADGQYASVTGGENNRASGSSSVVSGGFSRTAGGSWDWVAGTLFENN